MSLRRFVAALAVAVMLVIGPAGVALAADTGPITDAGSGTTVVTSVLPTPAGIERPNSGQAPEFSGDRGGWAQLTLFGVMSAAMLGIFVRVCYSTRQRTKARRMTADA